MIGVATCPNIVAVAPSERDVLTPAKQAKLSPRLNHADSLIAAAPQIDFPLKHSFVPGFYVRQIFMPKNSILTSKIHKTEHPFVITKGRLCVWSEDRGLQRICAPYVGITTPGTRRMLLIQEDTIWTTFHATDLTNLNEIEALLIEPHDIVPFDEKKVLEVVKMVTLEGSR